MVPGADSSVGGLFRKLLCYSGFCDAGRVDFHDSEVQFLSGFKEWLVSNCGPHSCNPYGAHWFPRCYSFGANDDRGGECADGPIGVSVCCREPRISKDEVIRSYVGDIEVEEMGSFSSHNFEFSVIFQTPSSIWGSVGVLEFSWVFHKMHPQLMLVNKALTNEALRGSTIEEGNIIGLFLCSV